MSEEGKEYFTDLEVRLAFNERQVEKLQQVINKLETRLTSSEGKLGALIRKVSIDLLQEDAEESSP
ncbi:MAG: hypothetical protein AAEJ04_02415 [Planctomycetota bacterium]